MKSIGILFLVLVCTFLYKTAHASTVPVYHSAYCSGYASKMAATYRMQYYYKMQKFYDSQVSSTIEHDGLLNEYYQSGSEAVKDNVSISHNLNDKCEEQFKRNK
ncbi:hypothetical protein pEaSNUABM50_00515 [Erwinia phage pEa_SNUABM_50]|uniref:Uncharacterized protein n=3 Tax=Eneladusvirus BF TaxID=2560751 RepID=A0A7L8ZPS2_9CAUD|nr:hypothetical protein FDH34_gp429 [Serratia phage BF]QOI71458.1 hypothetical protein pEaSNUABM12_00541 [Erwinia phage pEa_SNUABM_12]QOI72505.1 hypothetical protein pEaSNUABM50_00515 [Erwinia phage pEa_SNUABM_50]QXO11636.1 hypothetical protein pEaSNUABM19_00525 [Erwinia phage pEa_SNUABM_19]QXO12184.1 hypothetical protein pEaSNUABM44_00523 [Erwinia phage pEa_SNUABM_44]QXO12740.1 hypothetical protein pEaSNUABM49_00527 [Erwinia phage pEa_SNUABM_49]